ncbi:cytochrome P450 81Q32-like [Gastrolobium bilobum]|uniref:cytochrome P450 81Q32-like n=1 Tax=Gastrolobium bilobum TaxID=150636 RepID=UPI002AB0C61A|nr:cytochrome P450 81Q32-like [Gastrolobium bilobum]
MEEGAGWLTPTSIFLILFLFLSKYVLLKRKAKHRNLPPSPPALPLIGHLHLIKEPLHRSLEKLKEKYGHIIFLKLGTRKVLVVSSPSAVEECLTKNDITFANRPQTLAGKYLNYDGKTVGFASYGDYWRNLRRLTTIELFSNNRLGMFARVREEEIQLLVKQLFKECKGSQTSKVNLRDKLVELSFNIMLRMLSGKRYYGDDVIAQEGKEFQSLMKEYVELVGSGNLNDFLTILQWVDFQGIKKKMVKVMNKMDIFLQNLIEEHRRNRRVSSTKEQRNMTIIDLMLDLQRDDPQFYTEETIKALILAMLVAGSETSAITMEWSLSLLLNNPDAMKKTRFEIDTYVGQHHLLNELDTAKLKYLQNVITETMRLYPVAPLMIPHESSKDCKVCGFDIPEGTMLFVNLWTLHRDAEWWVEPTRFEPERFERGEGSDVLYNMIPFGIGRRACPGAPLAKRVMGHALGALIQCFEWERIGDQEINMMEGVGLTMPKVEPLVAVCRPRQGMIKVLSNI